jgi:hypothetical protein
MQLVPQSRAAAAIFFLAGKETQAAEITLNLGAAEAEVLRSAPIDK